MPTETEIKDEMLKAIEDKEVWPLVKPELDEFEKREGIDGKSVLQKFYSQWKSGKKGHKNIWNSQAAYYLGITSKKPTDPFFFEKRRVFARPSPPDIDSDFDYERRHEIIDYLVEKYGRGNVGNIGTYGALKMRSALTRLIKALDIANAFQDGKEALSSRNLEKVDEILGTLPKQRGAKLKVRDDQGDEQEVKNTQDAVKYCKDFRFYMQRHPEIVEHAANIEGLLSIFGVHASGIVLSDVPLDQIAPLRTAKDTGGTPSLATQFAYEDLENLGLIKFDILAISTLTVISECVKMIKENYGIEIDYRNLPLTDAKTYELYKTGNLVGVFQCESRPMQDVCVKIGVDRFDDIMATISLFRPGPMDSIDDYCDRKHGRKQISYFHPTIEPHVKKILENTYGILCYQEQLMRILEALGDMSPTKSLIVIKGVSKKIADIIEKGHKGFLTGAIGRGVPADTAEQYWERFVKPFAGYGFNLSHSCCYAYNSYTTAYLKANYPEEFMCSYMNVETRRRKLDRVLDLERECQRMGITILPRDVNKCSLKYEIVRKKDEAAGIARSEIRPAIHCKGLSSLAAENIVANRPYSSPHDLAEKTDNVVDSESIIALCDARFFKTHRDKVLKEFHIVREDMKIIRKKGLESRNIFGE